MHWKSPRSVPAGSGGTTCSGVDIDVDEEYALPRWCEPLNARKISLLEGCGGEQHDGPKFTGYVQLGWGKTGGDHQKGRHVQVRP